MSALQRLHMPLFVLDRRLPWNREKRHEMDVHSGGPFSVTTAHAQTHTNGQLEKLPVVTLLKLIALVWGAVAPVAIVFLLTTEARADKRFTEQWRDGFKEADGRYVSSTRYELRHDELVRSAAELKVKAEQAEAQRSQMELRMQQMQMVLESIRASQSRQEGRQSR